MKHQLITLITTALTLSLRAEPVSTAESLAVAVTEAKSGAVIELPFDSDEDVEIDHNILLAAISIPKCHRTRAKVS